MQKGINEAATYTLLYKIEVLSGIFANQSFNLDSSVLIGKDRHYSNIIFPENELNIAPFHCKIEREGSCVYITDLGSDFGTYTVDGRRLIPNKRYLINNGDCFFLGNQRNMFRINIYRVDAPAKEEKVTGVGKALAILLTIAAITALIIFCIASISGESGGSFGSGGSTNSSYNGSTCNSCGGTGRYVCSSCGGAGWFNTQYYDAVMGWQNSSYPCGGCNGIGWIPCNVCGGTGHR